MKSVFALLTFGLLAFAATAPASAQVTVNLGINPCGYPSVYQSCPTYGPPVGVYVGRGSWGGDRGWRGNHDHGRDRGRGAPVHGGWRHR
jgi:hypothetical protein